MTTWNCLLFWCLCSFNEEQSTCTCTHAFNLKSFFIRIFCKNVKDLWVQVEIFLKTLFLKQKMRWVCTQIRIISYNNSPPYHLTNKF